MPGTNFDLHRNAIQRDEFRAAPRLEGATVDDDFLRIDQIDHLDSSYYDGFWGMLMGLRPIRIKELFDTTISLPGIIRAILMKSDILFRHMKHLHRRSLAGDTNN